MPAVHDAPPPAAGGLPPAPGYRASLEREHGWLPLRLEGEIPASLRGTLYRVGPALYERFGRPFAHPFEADGAVVAIRLGPGGATGAHRVIENEALREERRAGRPLYGSVAPWPRRLWNGLRMRGRNAANTSLLSWREGLLALYEAAPPTELSPEDLSTLGETRLDGAIRGSFSAHPHAVVPRGALYGFGLHYGPRMWIDLYRLPDRGAAAHLGRVPLDAPVMLHDFVATERHLVFLVAPVRISVVRALLGVGDFADMFRWEPHRGTEVIVVPIDRPRDVTRFRVEASWQWHHVNGFERGSEIVLDRVRYADFESFERLGEGDGGHDRMVGRLTRTVVDPARRTLRDEPVYGLPCEFPRMDERRGGIAHRVAFLSHEDGDRRGVVRVDLEEGRADAFLCEPGQRPSEPVFVPRHATAAEGDGWLLTLVYDPASHISFLAILDTARMGDGPVARASFDHHVPMTFHGTWRADR